MHALCTAYPQTLYSTEGSCECLAGKGSHMGNVHTWVIAIIMVLVLLGRALVSFMRNREVLCSQPAHLKGQLHNYMGSTI